MTLENKVCPFKVGKKECAVGYVCKHDAQYEECQVYQRQVIERMQYGMDRQTGKKNNIWNTNT